MDLKPCPFCGGEAEICPSTDFLPEILDTKYYRVGCNRCGAQIWDKPKSKAIEKWNKRVEA